MFAVSLRRFAGCLVFASTSLSAAPDLSEPNLHALASSSAWIKLGHYEPHAGETGWRSAIHSERFFLAGAAGLTDPKAELKATLDALTQGFTNQTSLDDHPVCRFPARAMWLAKQLGPQWPIAKVTCPAYDRWTHGQQVESVSVILATGYLANPASYYGHTLLKLNVKGLRRVSELQDLSVNYGAIGTEGDDPVSYILKGIFGGYEGGFSEVQYHFHRHQYGDEELRDLWEYELNLSPEEVAFVVGHAWEVLGQTYDYFFFRRNCAYRMAELVEVIEGLRLIPEQRPWTVPQSVLQEVAQARRADGAPLLKAVRHQPSRQTEFYAHFRALSPEEQQVFRALAVDGVPSDHRGFTALATRRQQAVLDAVMHYHQFAVDPEVRRAGEMPAAYRRALAARYALPPGSDTKPAPEVAVPPHVGRRPGLLQLGISQVEGGVSSGLVRIRPAYYDPLDVEAAHVPHAALSMGDVRWRLRSGSLSLEQLDLIAIDSVNPGVSGLSGDGGRAWRLKAGVEPALPAMDDARIVRLQGDIGLGRARDRTFYTAVLLGGAVQESRLGQGHAFARVTGVLVWRPVSYWGVSARHERRHLLSGSHRAQHATQVESRWRMGADDDLRVWVERSRAHGVRAARVTLAWGRYW